MDKQTLHGIISWHEDLTLEIQAWTNGIEFTIWDRGKEVLGMILVDKEEFAAAIEEMYEQFVELPF